ncbi:DUF523 domain-containing protein [Hasllibacter sp. MH4015]|uniref:DUF523 domain-containing protein n=1 Tax=Hasllibacter sp. MH4015 TaxID=2854029 RepID=UPI001CD4FE28|nr:DUF523 domain-containing protein [Hasllibacter sp. MH4015]
MEKIFVSSCLLGARVRYDGNAKTLDDQILATWRAEGRLVSMCPEMAAGLPSPRLPAEIESGASAQDVLEGRAHVIDKEGGIVTAPFVAGADLAVEVAREQNIRFALLTDGSPSCGSTFVHGGHFDGQKHEGEGVVAARLRAAGVQVFTQERLGDLARAIEMAENAG